MGGFLTYFVIKFVQYQADMLHKTKYLIGIFSIDTIVGNPYMKALLEKEHREK